MCGVWERDRMAEGQTARPGLTKSWTVVQMSWDFSWRDGWVIRYRRLGHICLHLEAQKVMCVCVFIFTPSGAVSCQVQVPGNRKLVPGNLDTLAMAGVLNFVLGRPHALSLCPPAS